MRFTLDWSRWCLLMLGFCVAFNVHSDESPTGITGARTIDVFQAKQLYDRGALFVDVRGDEEWSIGHVEGAVHLDFQRDFAKLYSAEGVTRDTPLVLYCNSSNCLRSAYASAVSVYWGFKNVFYFRSGYFAWVLEDFPSVMSHVAVVDGAVKDIVVKDSDEAQVGNVGPGEDLIGRATEKVAYE